MWGHHHFSNTLILNDKCILHCSRVVHIGNLGPSDAVEREKRGTPIPQKYDENAVIGTPQWTRINWAGRAS